MAVRRDNYLKPDVKTFVKKQQERLIISGTDVNTHLDEFARAVRIGLSDSAKSIPSRFFYDKKGSELFEKICELPEYYLTRAEREILSENAGHIASLFSKPIILAELGSGSASKTRFLIDALIKEHGTLCYTPVDISRSILEQSSLALIRDFENLEVYALAFEYYGGLRRISRMKERRKLFLWLGSNVGNLEPHDASAFLKRIRRSMESQDRFLIGVDLKKDKDILESAYNDAQGVTEKFNLNLLSQVNRELGGKFDLNSFRHEARYNDQTGAVQMFLVSEKAQKVAIQNLDLEINFEPGESIHTENSYKYDFEDIEKLALESGFVIEKLWKDSLNRFSENLLKPIDGKD
jgi:dimethylhistidine N-methyltransferase